jgi:hypothetical protein
MEWPKPNREFLYATFNAFADKHPWVGETNIRPKSVAREMYETFATFAEYVRDYGLQRSEGVLLRYLADVYKTLSQAVPAAARTDEVLDIIGHFRLLLKEVDSSLIDEWESLKDPAGRRVIVVHPSAVADRPRDLADDPKALAVRVRAELHVLLKTLSTRDYAHALTRLRPDPQGDGEPWTEERLTLALAPYWAEHASMVTTPAARRPSNTVIQPLGPRRWRAQQRIIDPAGDEDWAIDCVVDLTGADAGDGAAGPDGAAENGPLLALSRIGV